MAQRFNVPVRTLIEGNGLQPPYRLLAGQQLRVPASERHVVRPGETLFAIARIHGVDQSSLARVNSLRAPYAVKPGQSLLLPGRVEAQQFTPADAPAGSPPTAPTAGAGSIAVENLPPSTGSVSPSAASAANPIGQIDAAPPSTAPATGSSGVAAAPGATPAAAPTSPPSASAAPTQDAAIPPAVPEP
ncbi:MAG: LysM peptidoglycan-binding domain-containing protein, partial [Dongiaceae bacterium]